ncbi:hypothetical protein O181_049501 [Austropuccinia psidii MF-1]|uniref:Beta-catenin-like protein 1 N-terminal domain-containing protein n=1 Tax=Austropuccinia psidii MF-1 TaxID=1389203 RepID=A0A9Q3HLF2_9BASI|nr:hypothetical protein [Austropuccinia psidii MF-1]
MDVSELFKTPAPKTDPTKTGVVANFEETNGLGKRSRITDELIAPSKQPPADGKRAKVSLKGKQRAEDPADDGSYWQGEEDEEGGRFFGDGLTSEQKEIIDILNHGPDDQADDQEDPAAIQPLSLVEVKRLCLNLERAINKNREMRTKFNDRPEKFVDSEFELSEAIVKMALMTQDPAQSYPELGRLGILNSLVDLLSHENVDIAISVVEILQELTDDDVLENQEDREAAEAEDISNSAPTEAMLAMVRHLIDNQLLEMLVSTLANRLNENEETERNGVFHCLGLIENLISLEPTLSALLVQKTPLMNYLLKRIRPPNAESQSADRGSVMFQNRQYASEIMAIILQKDEENRRKLVDLDGIDTLLEVLSAYRKRDPNDSDEVEFMENIFDALCSILLEPQHKTPFLKGEGVELMIIMMKQKKLAQHRALKVLDHALSGDEGSDNCERFVERMGLKTLFSFFMGKKNKGKQVSTHEDDEHILGIIVSLFFNLASDTELRLRLLAKFVEDEYEKVDRLIEIREVFETKIKHFMGNSSFLEAEMDETEIYLMKLDAGLFALQLTDVIIGWLCMEDDGIKDHIKMLLKRKSQDLNIIINGLKVYLDSMGDGPRKDGVEHLIIYMQSL